MISYIDPREQKLPDSNDSSLEEDLWDEEDDDDDKYDDLYNEVEEIINEETLDD